ncbi:hypothetical protein B6U90_01350 [Thermoplasmatales archaeon ex4484_6]|nr:MAG: hypothetical protein B6U90_01350 [Thermoplasmatales archaeon ex4484_6]
MGKELLFQEIMTDIGIVFVKGRGENCELPQKGIIMYFEYWPEPTYSGWLKTLFPSEKAFT